MSKLRCKIGEFCGLNLQHIFEKVVKAQSWAKEGELLKGRFHKNVVVFM